MSINIITYADEDFVFQTDWKKNERSSFDEMLISKWTDLQENGSCFRYKLKLENSKILPGKYNYLAQLNIKRAIFKRKPVNVQTMTTPFDPTAFNFTKMKEDNILFKISKNGGKTLQETYIAINESPFELGHSLLLPSLYKGLPQVATKTSLLTALEVFLLSKSPAMRIGFNGLNAYASINHLHFHIYYFQQQMLLETIRVERLSGSCYLLLSFPSQGFAFQMASGQDVEMFASDIFKLVDFLQKNEKPHNIFITRGTSFDGGKGLATDNARVYDHVRVYVWARKSNTISNDVLALQPALCEMFGHLIITNTQYYETLTEDMVSEIMTDLTKEPFKSVVDEVKKLYVENIN